VVLARPEGIATARAVCDELALLASAMTEGRAPSADELLGFVHACARDNAQNYSSMCMDVRAGRRTEIEELNGWVVRRAAQLGLQVCEANARLSEAVRARMVP
jgi:2-dehydropantoate 2-reductase